MAPAVVASHCMGYEFRPFSRMWKARYIARMHKRCGGIIRYQRRIQGKTVYFLLQSFCSFIFQMQQHWGTQQHKRVVYGFFVWKKVNNVAASALHKTATVAYKQNVITSCRNSRRYFNCSLFLHNTGKWKENIDVICTTTWKGTKRKEI